MKKKFNPYLSKDDVFELIDHELRSKNNYVEALSEVNMF